MYETIKKNLLQIQEDIEPCHPRIIAVTKYFPQDAIIKAYEAGIRDFGESRAVEACEKINNLPQYIKDSSVFHFIGHLQSNKVKYVAGNFDYIHSIDSLKLAQIVSEQCVNKGIKQKVLLQINNANEEQKFGFSKDEIFNNFGEIKQLKGIEVAGLMNMAPLGAAEETIETLFLEIVEIRNTLEKQFDCNLKEISMGMSQDYKIAAKVGATMIRVGRKLFN